MIKRNLALLCIVLISAVAYAAGFKDFSWDEMRFGGSASGVRKIVFDQDPDGSSAELSVDPANEEFVLNNKVNASNGLDVTGQLNVISTTVGSKPCPPMTEAQRDAIATPSDGDCIYNTDSKSLNTYDTNVSKWISVGSGAGGSGELSYIEGDNSDFENSVGDWVSYDDPPSDTPDDGTGAGATITCTRVEATDMLGAAHFRISKDAADRQGEGCSLDFTIDSTFANSPEIFWRRFRFKTSANYVEGDVTVHLYDVTNGALVGIYSPDTNTGKMVLQGEGTSYYRYQTVQGATSYRAIFHISTVNNLAYDVDIDRIVEGPINITHGPALTNWIDYPASGSWANATYAGRYRQIGDSITMDVTVTLTGSVSGDLNINLPNGYTIDTSKIEAVGNYQLGGTSFSLFNAFGRILSFPAYNNASSIKFLIIDDASGSSHVYSSLSATFPRPDTVGDIHKVTVTIPVIGLSSNTQYSQAFSNRDVVMNNTNFAAQVFTTGSYDYNVLQFGAPSVDTVAAWDDANDKYIIKSNGYYDINCGHSRSFGSNPGVVEISMGLRKNGGDWRNIDSELTTSGDLFYGMKGGVTGEYLVVGDEIECYARKEGTTASSKSGDARQNYFNITKKSTAQSLMETPVVAETYTSDSGQSIANNTNAIIVFEDADAGNTHGVCNTSTGLCTLPYPGHYKFCSRVAHNGGASATSSRSFLFIAFNGSGIPDAVIGLKSGSGGGGYTLYTPGGCFQKYFNAGDTVELGVNQSSGSSQTMTTSGSNNYLTIERIK